MKNKKVLVIVAHPDDETIWMGGTLLKNKNNWNTMILSLCRKNDKDREPKFRKACKKFKAKSIISDLDDEKLNNLPVEEVAEKIKSLLPKQKKFDFVFTHGRNGEYGHKRHIETHKAVRKIIDDKILSAKKLFFFSYLKKNDSCAPNKKSHKFINLDSLILAEKKDVIQKIYGFTKKSFEAKSCKGVETFRIQK